MSRKKDSEQEEGEAALARIADLLGCDVDAFGPGSNAVVRAAETSELLQLWLTIESREDRRKLLALARSMVVS